MNLNSYEAKLNVMYEENIEYNGEVIVSISKPVSLFMCEKIQELYLGILLGDTKMKVNGEQDFALSPATAMKVEALVTDDTKINGLMGKYLEDELSKVSKTLKQEGLSTDDIKTYSDIIKYTAFKKIYEIYTTDLVESVSQDTPS